MDCATSLTAVAPLSNPTLQFDTNIVAEPLGDWSTFVANADTTNCGISACSLKTPGCSGAYTGTELQIGESTPWSVTAKRNTDAGYVVEVCIECTNGADTQTYDNFKVTQIRNCGSALTAKADAPSSKEFNYVASGLEALGGWSTFFDNADDSNCGISSCVLKNSDCTGDYPGGQLSVGSGSLFVVSANKGIQAGWTETVCIECSNG